MLRACGISLMCSSLGRGIYRGGMMLCVVLTAIGSSALAQEEYANPHGLAVIVGNRTYTHEHVPEVAYAHRDAVAFRTFVLEVLGFNPENVIDLYDASQAQMEATFGNDRNHRGRLWKYLQTSDVSDVVVFYSGHGVPGLQDGRRYLLPADADPDSAEINGYPIALLFQNLGKLDHANSVFVFLDASFSGESQGGLLLRSASPSFVPLIPMDALSTEAGRLAALIAASDRQSALWDDAARHGLFTHHLVGRAVWRG